MQYAKHFSTRATPQTEKADSRQAKNNAGGYSFEVDDWQRLERFLILGSEGGTYYVGERKLTRDNAACVVRCFHADPERAAKTIADISTEGRAPKNDPAIFALAIGAGHESPAARKAALARVNDVCRIGTHLFQFVEAVQAFRGWGRSLRDAVARWYSEKDPEKLAYQLTKYRQRGGWSHRDVLRKCHMATAGANPVIRWAVSGADSMGARDVKRGDAVKRYESVGDLPARLQAFEALQQAQSLAQVVGLIRDHKFTHEMVPTEWQSKPEVWEALMQDMPLGALVRNLGRLTSLGLLAPLSNGSRQVGAQLGDVDRIRKAKLHPLAILSALKTYQAGRGLRGKLTWSPVQQAVDALDGAFYSSFQAIEPTGKPTVIGLDVSGSMTWGAVAGCEGLTPAMAAAAMCLVTAKTESNYVIMGFSHHFVDLKISPRQRLDDVLRVIGNIPFGRTDCALPMLWATESKMPAEVFAVYTDSETYCGGTHPHQALRTHREKLAQGAKLAVVAMTGTQFTIADPSDPGMLDFVGFDTAAPRVLADFARG